MKKVALTGIKPTGEPHLGNYLGAIKPALALAAAYEARYFIADYHALNTVKTAQEMRGNTLRIAACWLACGLDPDKALLYRQSDIPEIFELAVFLNAFAAKGLMNRAHAYKAAVDKNLAEGQPPDSGINMGLYSYPILMAADILLFDTDVVPVGRDQKQHIEMAQDIAQAVNFNYKTELLRVPQPHIEEQAAIVAGLDGRKMSKSYQNVIPLFAEGPRLKKLVNSIVTNSQGVDEPKEPEGCSVFALYKLFASPQQTAAMAQRYRAGGMGWGEAKTALYVLLEQVLGPMRQKYQELAANPQIIEDILAQGAVKARALAKRTLQRARRAAGFEASGS